MKTTLFLAYKDIIRDKKIVTLVIFLLAFSYINLTFFPAFLNGLSNTFQDEIVNTATSHIIITPTIESNSPYISMESSIRKKIDLIPGVVKSSSQIGLTGTVVFRGRQMGARMIGLTPSEDMEVTTISSEVLKGSYLSDQDTNEIVLGEIVAGRRLEDTIGQEEGGFGAAIEGLGGVDVGDRVTVRYQNGVEREYRVKAIAGSQGFSSVSQSVYITKKEAEDVLGVSDKASSILVRLNNKGDADKYKQLILGLGIPSAKIQTWEEASTFAQGLNQTFGIVIVVANLVGVVIVMATIGIVIFINTSRKRRIIGVLKAIGLQKNDVMMVFLMESLIFGVIGTVIGVAIVYAMVFYLTANPISLPVGMLTPALTLDTAIGSVLVIVICSVIAGYLPARMAAKGDILDNIKVVE